MGAAPDRLPRGLDADTGRPSAPAPQPSPAPGDRLPPLWTAHDVLTALALLGAIAIYLLWPELDLRVSQALHTPGQGFADGALPWVQWSYHQSPWVGRGLLLGVFIAWLAARLGWRAISPARRAAAGVALCTALLGPGLLIEGVFKPELQRPRPVQTADFGGSQPYHPPLRPCWACTSHHSFVSSHAAAGFWLMSWGLLAAPAWRRRWFAIGLACGAVIGWGRMLQGGHYLGDVVFSFFTVWASGQVVLAAWRWRLARRARAAGGGHRSR